MENEYIIGENEIAIVFIDGKINKQLKPGKYKLGINAKDLHERQRKVLEAQERYQISRYEDLNRVPTEIVKKVKKLNRVLKIAGLFGKNTMELKERIYQTKLMAYQDYTKIPEKIREKLVEYDKEYDEANKEPQIIVRKIDLRQLTLTITGQEMLTKDKVSIRINVITQYRVKDPILAVTEVIDYEKRLYEQVQMIIREYAAANSLDQLLTNKNTIGKYIREQVKMLAKEIGLEVTEVGLKDIILPGAIQEMMKEQENTTKFLFLNNYGSPIKPRNIRKWWQRERQRAGVSNDVKFQHIRDATQTIPIDDDPTLLFETKLLMGHDITGVTNNYLQRRPTMVKRACKILEEHYFGKTLS